MDNTLYVSGQIGFLPETMEIVAGGVAPEARQALTNMGHVLQVQQETGAHKYGTFPSGRKRCQAGAYKYGHVLQVEEEARQALTNM